jgi:hypothetical protein
LLFIFVIYFCLQYYQVILVQHDFTASRVEMLNAQIEAYTDTLVEEQVHGNGLLSSCSRFFTNQSNLDFEVATKLRIVAKVKCCTV